VRFKSCESSVIVNGAELSPANGLATSPPADASSSS